MSENKKNAPAESADDIRRSEQKFRMMTETKIEPLIMKMAVPTIASMLVSSIYNMADTYFVGKISTSASGAIGIVFSLMSIIQAVGFFYGHGSGNFISRQMGMKNYDVAHTMATTGFFLSFMTGCVITLLGSIFLEPLAMLLGSTQTILPYAMDYMRIILFGAPFMTSAFTMNNQLRFQGSALYGMIGIMTGGLLNIALDPLFMFTFDMGIMGASTATILCQFISFLILLVMVRKKALPISIRRFRVSANILKNIVNGGTPSLSRQVCNGLSAMFVNWFAGPYGDAAIAAMAIVSKISTFAQAAMIGFGQGFQPVCGFNYGAKRFDRVKKAFAFCVRGSTIFLAALSIVGAVFAPQLVTFFRDDAAVTAIGTTALRFSCISFTLLGFITLTNMMTQVIGKGVRATALSVMRSGVFLIICLAIFHGAFGLLGIQMAQMWADFLAFIFSAIVARSVLKEMNTMSDPPSCGCTRK